MPTARAGRWPCRPDVTDEVLVRRVFREAALAYGGVDIVVSNAGLLSVGAIADTTLAEWQRLHDVLSTGYFLVARAAFRLWQEQGTGGSLVFVGLEKCACRRHGDRRL